MTILNKIYYNPPGCSSLVVATRLASWRSWVPALRLKPKTFEIGSDCSFATTAGPYAGWFVSYNLLDYHSHTDFDDG
jgi:hypothetical protein